MATTSLLSPSHAQNKTLICSASSFVSGKHNTHFNSTSNFTNFINSRPNLNLSRVRAIKEKTEEVQTPSSSPDEITEKFGLEAGLWKIFTSKEEEKKGTKAKGDQAKELLAKYGGAYLATSITLSLISFSLCYALINVGVDVPALLLKVGISAGGTEEKVGTFALAYAAHKAASPIRFPPTVALTPVVANWISKILDKENK